MATEMELDRTDKTTLERLNREYVDAFMNADVEWYREHLADDFVVIESDGSVVNKAQFLSNTAKDLTLVHYLDIGSSDTSSSNGRLTVGGRIVFQVDCCEALKKE